MAALKLFISHSSKTSENRTLLDQISAKIDQLENGPFDVLVDNRIEAGTEWFAEINEWMMECHIAVILLSEDALKSEWVKAESAVLCARRRSKQDFPLFLVPLGSVDAEQLDDHPFFKVIRITDFQMIRDCQNDNEIIASVCQHLCDQQAALLPDDTPFNLMATQIGEILNQLDQETLARALQQPATEQNLARHLSRQLLRDPKNIFAYLQKLFERLATVITQQQANQLLKIVKGHWVHPEAGASLNIYQQQRQAVAINGVEIEDFTGDCYARKAWPFPQGYTLVSVGSDRTFEDIEETLLSSKIAQSAINQKRAKRRVQAYKDPLLLVFPHPEDQNTLYSHYPDKALIEDIIKHYDNVTVVLGTGLQAPENINYVQSLEPILQDGLEGKQCDDYEALLYYINQQLAD